MGHEVLFITFWYSTPNDKFNGIFIKEHASALVHAGHQLIILHFDIIYNKSFFQYNEYFLNNESPAPVYRIEIHSRFWKWFYHCYPLLNILALRACKKIRKNGFHPQIIHANVIFPSGLVGYFLSKKLKLPAVLSEHWSGFETFCRHPLFRKKAGQALQRSKCIMPVSNFLAGRIMPFVKDQAKIQVIPNIIDINIFKLSKIKNYAKPYNSLNFMVIASWHKRKVNFKRPDIIFESLKIFSLKFKGQVTLRVIGDGNLLDKYKKESLNYPFKCIFTGFVSKEEINGFFQETDFFLHASDSETFSAVAAEALMTGTPVIVSDLPALRELVNSDNGILVKNDVSQWAEAINDATRQKWDAGKISASVSKRYSYESVGQKITSVYDQVINKN